MESIITKFWMSYIWIFLLLAKIFQGLHNIAYPEQRKKLWQQKQHLHKQFHQPSISNQPSTIFPQPWQKTGHFEKSHNFFAPKERRKIHKTKIKSSTALTKNRTFPENSQCFCPKEKGDPQNKDKVDAKSFFFFKILFHNKVVIMCIFVPFFVIIFFYLKLNNNRCYLFKIKLYNEKGNIWAFF